MPKSEKQKMKLLVLADLLRRETDEEHGISMNEILSRLESEGIRAERKSIYDDIRTLEDYGMDIVSTRGRSGQYRLVHRAFELPELKLLVDAVQSCRFLSAKKSRELIRKLEGLTSRHEAQSLQRQVYAAGRRKSMNESIYYSIDMIHAAISQDRQIAFRYFEWTPEKKIRLRREGSFYRRSPYALIWDSENYYLVAFDHTACPPGIRHYRVDKMKDLSIVRTPRLGKELFADIDMAEYASSRFGMFGGTPQSVELRFASHLAGVVFDRFGKDITVLPCPDGSFRIHADAVISPQFMGWLSGFGTDAQLLGPPEAVTQYIQFCETMLAQYK